MRPVRLGILIVGTIDWPGGVNYVINLVKAISQSKQAVKPELFFIINNDNSESYTLYESIFKYFKSVIIVGDKKPNIEDFFGNNVNYFDTFKEIFSVIDLVYPLLSDAFENLNCISWIPDFQHLHLPNFFSQAEINGRNMSFDKIARNAKLVVFSSKDAEKDFKYFYPYYTCATRVLNFHTLIEQKQLNEDPDAVIRKYSLPNQFILNCNQFWVHKDHKTVFEAIAKLKINGIILNLVCTGAKEDYRFPDYYKKLNDYIYELGIEDQVFILGFIPRDDQIQLIRKSCALIQSSWFEGWSTVVEDGRALGKYIVLSDIDVHKEQHPEFGLYFKKGSVDDLVRVLYNFKDNFNAGPDLEKESTVIQKALEFQSSFSMEIINIIRYGCEIFNIGSDAEQNEYNSNSRGNENTNLLKQVETFIKSNNIIQAKILLDDILTNNPYNVMALNDLAIIEIINKNYSEANAILNRVLEISPGNNVALKNKTLISLK
jgi:glycosyltransferase involved in cell wall biosynthesis